MNRSMIFSMIGQVCVVIGALMLLPLGVSIYFHERCALAFLITMLISIGIGMTLQLIFKKGDQVIYAKEGFIIVALSWIILSAIGALPFVISHEIPNFIDAFFETVSGFTTTGSSILRNVERLSKGLLFWRSFTHWIGGMGVIVFMMAIVPSQNDRNMHVMRAEVPGPTVGKLVPRLRDTARILYLLYIALSIVEMVFLLAGGMPLFDSLCHMFGTAGTGGFGIKADSITSYSPYLQWVITIFMLLFGVNFNIYYLIVRGQLGAAIKSTELRCYLGIWLAATVLIVFNLVNRLHLPLEMAVRQAAFQTSSIMTTTGYGTTDFNLWPQLSKTILFFLMFIGACAGSTGGGLKVSRVMMLASDIKRELRHLLHPRSVQIVKFEGKRVDNQTLRSVNAYFTLYIVLMLVMVMLLAFDDSDFETDVTAVVACFNNIGPGFGAVGPASNFADYSGFSKLVLSAAMLLGRLEIYPILIALTPSTWVKMPSVSWQMNTLKKRRNPSGDDFETRNLSFFQKVKLEISKRKNRKTLDGK
ncbi:MAG: TrkH family potassium uptake protein [Firmicutes bacterium]|nr:TrkH family potassium uptake protein [Bacillota bacterium]